MSKLTTNTTNLQSILETINNLPEAISVDDALSEISTNPVQNKIVTEALNQKANSIHTQAATTITEGTFSGQVIANSSGQAESTSLLRNSKLVSEDTNPTVNGEICWTYA